MAERETDMRVAVEDEDGDTLHKVGDEVAVPQQIRCPLGDCPQNGDDRQREREGDEQSHVVMATCRAASGRG